MGRWATVVMVAVAIFLAGSFAEASWRLVRVSIPEMGRKEIEPTLGQGVLLGVLGGLRTVIADGTWLRSYVAWEKRDRAGCESLMRTACALDPRARYFWENTGYVMGYDMAHWEIRRRGGYARVSKEIQDDLFKQYARKGLAVLEEGAQQTGGNAGILISAGQLAETKLKDMKLAAAYYQRATESVNVPWFAYFLCARAQWEAGQKNEAYTWYRQQWLEKLKGVGDNSPDDLERLRFMESELNIPLLKRIPKQLWEK